MNGGISDGGALVVQRGGQMITQYCPYTARFCGGWCPHFGEPNQELELASWQIELTCGQGRRWRFHGFTDDRDKLQAKRGRADKAL